MNRQKLKLDFCKMHGIGNDYIYVVPGEAAWSTDPERVGALAATLSDRHFGVGGDGLVLIRPSQVADIMMDMYNSDGSRGKMCGNAIRCVARYAYERGLCVRDTLRIETLSGIRTVWLQIANESVQSVTVDMGAPVLDPAQIPVLWPGSEMVEAPVEVDGKTWSLTAVSMGNPHVVTFLNGQDIEELPLETLGPAIEHHALFPDRINTEFVQVLDRRTLRMRVWERGSGETMACGTGSCASLAAAVLTGRSERRATVRLNGGDLQIDWRESDGHIYMTGPAAFVFDGSMNVEV